MFVTYQQNLSPLLVFTSWQLVAGGLMLLPIALVVEGFPPELAMNNVLGFAWLGMVGTGVAYVLWFRGIGKLRVSTVALLGLLSPVSAMFLDILVLKKSLSPIQSVGTALVFGGIFISQTGRKQAQLNIRTPGESVLKRRRLAAPNVGFDPL